MILENMTASEKMTQMNKVTPLLLERVNGFLDRNSKLVKKQFKTKTHLEFNRPFKFAEYGEWDVFIFLTKISKEWAKIGFHAYQKYYVKYAKDPSNIGAGFYVIQHSLDPISEEKKLSFVEITPHCVNRFRERVPETAEMSLDILKTEIVSEGGFGSCEFSTEKRCEEDDALCNCTIHTMNGQFFGWVTDTVHKYICYRTFVPNDILKREQLAYTIATKESGKSNYDTEQMKENANKLIVKMAKHGEDVHNMADKKKDVMVRASVNNLMSRFLQRVSRDRIDKILGMG